MAKSPGIILASTSPRRIGLMAQVGIEAAARAPRTDEARKPGESPRAMVGRLSREKAWSVAGSLGRARGGAAGPGFIVIAADTIVVSPDGRSVLGKPSCAGSARRMLRLLAGREHSVLTGYSVVRADARGRVLRTLTRVVLSRVRMRKLSREDIARYVRTGEPMDKAGSYAAQGRGMAFIESIRGSYTNVVGLPMCQLVMDLEKEFGLRLFAG